MILPFIRQQNSQCWLHTQKFFTFQNFFRSFFISLLIFHRSYQYILRSMLHIDKLQQLSLISFPLKIFRSQAICDDRGEPLFQQTVSP